VELHAIAIRCLFAYGFLLLVTRLSGKHSVSEATPFDFVMALILGDIIDDVILAEVEVSRFIAAAGTLIFLDVLTTFMTHRSVRMARWLEGLPTVAMIGGVMDRRALKGEQMNEKDLEALLRLDGFGHERYAEIDKAIFETNGELSVLPILDAEEVRKRDAGELKRKSHA
jgi:uncharacterized membrane protein YcaP (DUF421 family)